MGTGQHWCAHVWRCTFIEAMHRQLWFKAGSHVADKSIIIITSIGLASLAPCCTRFGYLPSHSYIPAHMHIIKCCKQGCERADLAHMKSSKERLKGTDYVNSTRLILQLCSIVCCTCALISSRLGHMT